MKKSTLVLTILLSAACSKQSNINTMADANKPVRGDYWATRYSYPTFQYNQTWLVAAKKEHNRNPTKIPSNKNKNISSFKGLDPNGFIALGPKPLGNPNAAAYSGRVNVIVGHPTDDSTAYMGVDGGGVWLFSR